MSILGLTHRRANISLLEMNHTI